MKLKRRLWHEIPWRDSPSFWLEAKAAGRWQAQTYCNLCHVTIGRTKPLIQWKKYYTIAEQRHADSEEHRQNVLLRELAE